MRPPRRAAALALALALALPAAAAAQAPTPAGGKDIGTGLVAGQGDPPPPVAGVRLGDPADLAIALLGPPDPSAVPEDPNAPVRSLSFRGGAVMALVSAADGVARIMLTRPEGGEIGGLRVGDPWEAATERWGEPTSANPTTLLFARGGWFLAVQIDQASGTIRRLMQALVQSKAQPVDLPPPAWAKPPAP